MVEKKWKSMRGFMTAQVYWIKDRTLHFNIIFDMEKKGMLSWEFINKFINQYNLSINIMSLPIYLYVSKFISILHWSNLLNFPNCLPFDSACWLEWQILHNDFWNFDCEIRTYLLRLLLSIKMLLSIWITMYHFAYNMLISFLVLFLLFRWNRSGEVHSDGHTFQHPLWKCTSIAPSSRC